jgi:hypothetical protein
LSLNGWNYVNANPINFTDPSGYGPLGPVNFAMCFNMVASPSSIVGNWFLTAGQAVDIYQTFTWTEKRDECVVKLLPLLPLEVRINMLDIHIWPNYENHTESVFP